jgi:hypothetical protein
LFRSYRGIWTPKLVSVLRRQVSAGNKLGDTDAETCFGLIVGYGCRNLFRSCGDRSQSAINWGTWMPKLVSVLRRQVSAGNKLGDTDAETCFGLAEAGLSRFSRQRIEAVRASRRCKARWMFVFWAANRHPIDEKRQDAPHDWP